LRVLKKRLHCSKQTPTLPEGPFLKFIPVMSGVSSSRTARSFGLNDVEIIERVSLHEGFLQVARLTLRCRLFEGGWSREFTREVLLRGHGVGVLLYDPHLDKVLMVEQFRVGCMDDPVNGPWALELVAGLLEEGETPEDVARREVFEEAGVTIAADGSVGSTALGSTAESSEARSLLRICEYYNSPGGSNEKLSVFCAGFDATQAGGVFGVEDEAENIRSVILDRTEALAAVAAGRINNAMSIIALQWLQLNLETVKDALART
jgi:ADP-ribose pyrophosphatase